MDSVDEEQIRRSLYADFPKLMSSRFRIASEPSDLYNCLAWAIERDDQWWWPVPERYYPGSEAYWPAGAPFSEELPALVAAYALSGFEPCQDGSVEPGRKKIAIYAKGNEYTHAARQLAEGWWASKIGQNADIEHVLEDLEGDFYGTVSAYLRSRIA